MIVNYKKQPQGGLSSQSALRFGALGRSQRAKRVDYVVVAVDYILYICKKNMNELDISQIENTKDSLKERLNNLWRSL